MAESPPNTPEPSCMCATMPLISANSLADSLGVSPLYKQADSARWSSAAQVYKSSRAHSPTSREAPATEDVNVSETLSPKQLAAFLIQNHSGRTPLSLEDIATANRRRHAEEGGTLSSQDGGPLELEAIAAVHELATQVEAISVSEMLPRTSDLIFVNVKTLEKQPYTLELTLKGWRIASNHSDCMNGDYTNLELYTKYYNNARELLNVISPANEDRFFQKVSSKLVQLQNKSKDNNPGEKAEKSADS